MAIEGSGIDPEEREQIGSIEAGHPMGVRVIVDDDPTATASRLADEIGGEVIGDADSARIAFAERADAARTVPVVLHDEERHDLVAQADELSSIEEKAPVDAATAAELRELADAIGRTARIRMRTEIEFGEALHRRLSATSGVVVHPETIKQAADVVTDAERDLDEIDDAIERLGPRPRPEQVELDSAEVHELFDDEHLERRRRSRALALAAVPFFGGAAVILSAVLGSVVVPVAVFAVGIVLALILLIRSGRGGTPEDRGEREASALLAAATGNAERTTEAAVRGRLAEEEWLSQRARLDAARERVDEQVRSARRHWETLAGSDADPYDLDTVLQLHDPQFLITAAASQTSPTVRAVTAVHRRAVARWKVAWAELGYDEPPPPEEVDEHLSRLNADEARTDALRAGERLKAAEAWATAGQTIDRAMILVEPYTWVEEDELSSMLAMLPAGAEVILVTR